MILELDIDRISSIPLHGHLRSIRSSNAVQKWIVIISYDIFSNCSRFLCGCFVFFLIKCRKDIQTWSAFSVINRRYIYFSFVCSQRYNKKNPNWLCETFAFRLMGKRKTCCAKRCEFVEFMQWNGVHSTRKMQP